MSRSVSVGKNLTPDAKTTMYTVPEGYIAKWNLLYALNGTAAAKDFSVWWYDKSADTEVAIAFEYPITASNFLRIDGGAYVALEEGDEVRVKIEAGATNASCLVTFELDPKSPTKFNTGS